MAAFTDDELALLALSAAGPVGSGGIARLRAAAARRRVSLRDVLGLPKGKLQSEVGLRPDAAACVAAMRSPALTGRSLVDRLCSMDIYPLIEGRPGWPERLTLSPGESAPAVLFVKGDPSILSRSCVAVVGSRRPSREALGAAETAEAMLERKEFRGLTVSPAMQAFHPADSRAMALYDLADGRGAPVFIHQGTHLPARGRMEYARPFLLDEIAREFPNLTMVISSLGHPWVEEAIALLGKHPRVFADVAGLIRRPWQAYNALVLAHQFNVMDKVLFGSDFPYYTAAEAIEAVYRLHEVIQGTNLPSVPRETLRGMIERDALTALGIALPGESGPVHARTTGEADEDEPL